MSDISVEEEQRGEWLMYVVVLEGEPIVACACASMSRRASRILDEARNAGPRRAMSLLTEQLGMCEDFARHTIKLLTGTPANIN